MLQFHWWQSAVNDTDLFCKALWWGIVCMWELVIINQLNKKHESGVCWWADRIWSSLKLQPIVFSNLGKLIAERKFFFILIYTYSYVCISVQFLICEPLPTVTGFLQQPLASWCLCQAESGAHGRSCSPFNTGVCLYLFFLCSLGIHHCPPLAAREMWPACTGWLHPRDTHRWCLSLLGCSCLWGRWCHTAPGTWEPLTSRQSGW